MFTEDDTFRRLVQCSYDEAWRVVDEFRLHVSNVVINKPFDPIIIDALRNVGWSELGLKKRYRDNLLKFSSKVVDYDWWDEFIALIEKLEDERR